MSNDGESLGVDECWALKRPLPPLRHISHNLPLPVSFIPPSQLQTLGGISIVASCRVTTRLQTILSCERRAKIKRLINKEAEEILDVVQSHSE